ncbi:MAG: hypothetical protein IPN62_18410 [Flavobacteriales bacterium]|jgi:hypothetical protein|nr:hypothetical protein [Flavobacteriales bacterium]
MNNRTFDQFKAMGASFSDAKAIADLITNDPTVGGVFPKGDLANPDHAVFKAKWCSWWGVAKVLLQVAKVFTNDAGDKVIDKLIQVGDTVCK